MIWKLLNQQSVSKQCNYTCYLRSIYEIIKTRKNCPELPCIRNYPDCRFFIIMSPWKRFEQAWIAFTQGCFVQSLLKLTQWFWKRRWKFGEFTDRRTDRRTTDDRRSEKPTWTFSSGKRKKRQGYKRLPKYTRQILYTYLSEWLIHVFATQQTLACFNNYFHLQ